MSSAKASSTCQAHMLHLLTKYKGPGMIQIVSSQTYIWYLVPKLILISESLQGPASGSGEAKLPGPGGPIKFSS
jgi:hypothetical protein